MYSEIIIYLWDSNFLTKSKYVQISKLVHKSELKAMKAFMTEHEVTRGYIVCLEATSRKIEIGQNKETLIMPIKEFLHYLWQGESITQTI